MILAIVLLSAFLMVLYNVDKTLVKDYLKTKEKTPKNVPQRNFIVQMIYEILWMARIFIMIQATLWIIVVVSLFNS
jgi:hypothetical protein